MELWEVFSELLNQKGVKVSDVAKATGLAYTTVDSIIKKKLKDIKFSSAEKIANYFGVDPEYLYDGRIKISNVIPIDPSSIIMLPVYGEIAAGIPITANQEYNERFPMDTRFFNLNGHSIEDFFFLEVRGDSMEPGIMNGDLVLVRKQPAVETNEIAVVIYDKENATIKRVTVAGDKMVLNSDNKAYPPQIYNAAECQILGKVLQRVGEVK